MHLVLKTVTAKGEREGGGGGGNCLQQALWKVCRNNIKSPMDYLQKLIGH